MNSRLTIVMMLLIGTVLCSAADAQNDVIVMSIKGKVEYQKRGRGKRLSLQIGMGLSLKDVIRTSFASYVKLMYKKRHLLSVDENATVTVGSLLVGFTESGRERNSQTGKILAYIADKFKRSREGTEKQTVYGAIRGSEEIFNAAFPRKGYVLSARPLFEWVNGGEPSLFTFTIVDEEFNTIKEQSVDTTILPYGPDDPDLMPGNKYLWRVIRENDFSESDIAVFTILSEQTADTVKQEIASLTNELRKMNADGITLHIILGTYYEQRELYQDAFREYREAIRLAPGVEEYMDMAYSILYRVGLYAEHVLLLPKR